MSDTNPAFRIANKAVGKKPRRLFRRSALPNMTGLKNSAANIGIAGTGMGAMIGVKLGVGALMAASGFWPLMATTALASGVIGGAMHVAMQYRQAKQNGTTPPKFWRTFAAQSANTAANVATMGGFGLAKTCFQASKARSWKDVFDWRDPASYLKLGVFAGAVFSGGTLFYDNFNDKITNLAQSTKDYIASTSDSIRDHIPEASDTFNNYTAGFADVLSAESQGNTSIEAFAPQDNADPVNANPGDTTLGFAEELIGEDATPYLEEKLQSADNNPQAMKDLAHTFAHGEDGAPQDYDMARKLAEQAAESGNEQAKAFLADLDKVTQETVYASEADPQQTSPANTDDTADIPRPSEKPETPSEQQDNAAADNVGQHTEQTDTTALTKAGAQIDGTDSDYLQSALARAENGTPQGMKDLAHAYLTGRDSLDQDSDLARQLYEQAAEAGNEQAIRDLATIDRLGESYFEDKYGETASQSTTPDNETTNAQKIGFCLKETFEANDVDGNLNVTCFFNNEAAFTQQAYMTAHIDGSEHRIAVSPMSEHENMKISNMDAQTRHQITNGIIAPRTQAIMSHG